MQKKRITVIALISRNIAIDNKIWKYIEEGIYLIVLALPEIILQLTTIFWLSILREKSNIFY